MLKFNVTTGQFDYIRSIAWLDGRFVNTTGDTMTGSLGMPSESYIGPTSTNGIYFKSNNIGIGTTNPIQKLDLNGKLAINGSVQIYNASSLDGFIGSVFFGDGGTFLSHSSGDQGYYNFGIGSGALYSNTTGLMNTGIGVGALFTNTIGGQNFALGFHSMYKNISGQQNLGIGSYSLEANTTGNYNLAIGNVSLFYNTTGTGNVSIGYDSGSFNRDWGTLVNNNYCVYIGYDSKGSASGNTNEIAIGFNVDGNGSNTATIGDGNITDFYSGTNAQATIRTPKIKTDTTTPTDLNITTGVNKTLVLATPVYNDLYTAIASAKIPASNYPDWTAFTTNTNAYTFKVNDYADLATVEILHDYKEGTDLEVHLHLATNGLNNATARKVKYMVYYTYANPDNGANQFSAESTLTAELDIPANQADKSAYYLSLGTITGTNIKIGCQIKFRVKRIACSGTEPINNPFLGMVGIHYQIERLGSRSISAA